MLLCQKGYDEIIFSIHCAAYKQASERTAYGFTSCIHEFLLKGCEYVITNMNLF